MIRDLVLATAISQVRSLAWELMHTVGMAEKKRCIKRAIKSSIVTISKC